MEKEKTIKIGDQEVKVTKTGQQLTKGQTFSAIVVGSLVGLLAVSGLPKQNIGDWFSNIFTKQQTITQDDEENKDLTYEDYANMEIKYSQEELSKMSYEELANVLTEYNGIPQREVFDLLEEQQGYMNEVFSTIKDGEKQVYVTLEEVASFYIIANMDSITQEELITIFGNSGLLNAEDIISNYESFKLYVAKFYSRQPDQKLELSKLFKDESDKKLFEQFENVLLEFHTATPENKKEKGENLVKFLKEIINIEKTDNATRTNRTAAALILGIGEAEVTREGLITESELEEIDKNYTKIMCDEIYNELEDIDNLTLTVSPTGIYIVVYHMIDAANRQNVPDVDRDIAWGNYEYNENYKGNYKGNYNFSTGKTEISREEAVNIFGEEEVRRQEQIAKDKIDKENANQDKADADYSAGYNAGYVAARDYAVATGGKKLSTSISGKSAAYQSGYAQGVNAGYQYYIDVVKPEQDEVRKEEPGKEVIETPVQPSNPTPTPAPTPQPVQPEPTPVPETPTVVETPGSSEQVIPDASQGEEVDPEFVGTSTNNLDNRYFGIVDQDEFTVTYLVSEKSISRVRSL